MSTIQVKASRSDLTVKAYRGDGAVLLAFDLDEHLTDGFAGFAVKRTDPDGSSQYLPNRLSFTQNITHETEATQRVWTPSNEAPFQKYRWVDFPPDVMPGVYTYEVTEMYFQDGGALDAGASVDVSLEITGNDFGKFRMGFTRGYMSSQAYADKFHNADYRTEPHSIEYDPDSYRQFEAQYKWLGFHARKLVFDFMQECLNDASVTVDLFAYDLDEPLFINQLTQLGDRLRAVLDNASLHTKPGALEIDAKAALITSAGEQNIVVGHFSRFAHDKVLIMKKDGVPVKVLTGSANFSIRGFYVQANNIMVFDNPATAKLYEDAFNQAFTDMHGFAHSDIAQQWFDVAEKDLPTFSVCFSPHTDSNISLQRVAEAVKNAGSSVMYAIMELSGSGDVLDDIKALGNEDTIFSYGVTQSDSGLNIYKPGAANGELVPFSYLSKQVPPPFHKETSGGVGQVIHDKFIVVDFNDNTPILFTGSSNLAAGGEEANGDNLLAITDQSVVTAYAVEAIRLIDHFHFRASMKAATDVKPLSLHSDNWWQPYYDVNNIKCRERSLFIR